MDVLKDIAHELLAGSFPLFLVFSDLSSSFLSGSWFLKLFSPLFSIGFILSFSLFLSQSIIRVQFFHQSGIFQWILLILDMNDLIFSSRSNNRLNFIGINDSGQISMTHNSSMQLISFLVKSLFRMRSEQFVQSSKSTLSPNNESS